jgi:hypothetical protein
MEIGKIIDDSFGYAKEGLVGKWETWVLLIISCIIFPLFMGYTMRIYRGAKPLPAVDNWGDMFIDGIKLLIVGLIYTIPVLIIGTVLIGSTGLALFLSAVKLPSVDPGAIIGFLAAILVGAIILVIVAVIIGLIVATAGVRFARTNSYGEAFNFSAIFTHIGRIGWLTYITSLVLMVIIVGLIKVICLSIPFIGILLLLIVAPFTGIFSARYLTLLYDNAGAP